MVTYLLPTIIFSVFSILILLIYYLKNDISVENMKEFLGLFFILGGISLIIIITIFPFPIDGNEIDFMLSNDLGLKHSWIPLQTVYESVKEIIQGRYGVFFYQIIGNILLFIPLGIGVTLYLSNNKKYFRKVFFIILITTISMEALQFIFGFLLRYNYRSTDVDDIILNTIGGLIGYYIISQMNKKKELLN